jgi:RimJ/RimL family protein N-acetyltransferase
MADPRSHPSDDVPGTLKAGAGLALVPRHVADAAEMFALIDAARADLDEWLGWVGDTLTVADARRYAQLAEGHRAERLSFDYSIRVDGAIAGGMGLHNFDWAGRNAHVGYWIAPRFRGRGAVTRAAAAITSFGFTTLGLHRLEIRCVVENRRSRAVAERLGYELEGTLREAFLQHGEFRNIALYAMVAERWRERAGGRA